MSIDVLKMQCENGFIKDGTASSVEFILVIVTEMVIFGLAKIFQTKQFSRGVEELKLGAQLQDGQLTPVFAC